MYPTANCKRENRAKRRKRALIWLPKEGRPGWGTVLCYSQVEFYFKRRAQQPLGSAQRMVARRRVGSTLLVLGQDRRLVGPHGLPLQPEAARDPACEAHVIREDVSMRIASIRLRCTCVGRSPRSWTIRRCRKRESVGVSSEVTSAVGGGDADRRCQWWCHRASLLAVSSWRVGALSH